MNLRHFRLRLFFGTAVLLASFIGLVAPAGAHNDGITFEVTPTVTGSTVKYDVHLLWTDGHPASGQVVKVVAAQGSTQHEATLPPSSAKGDTSGAVELGPGSWDVTFSVGTSSTKITTQIAAPTTTAAAVATTTTAMSNTTTTAAATSTSAVPADTQVNDQPKKSSNTWLVPALIVAGAVILIGGVGLYLSKNKSRPAPPPGQ
jgi:hypothetical protein